MTPKGHLTDTGRVVRRLDPDHSRRSLDGETIVADIYLKVTRYNLRRVYVAQEWIVRSLDRTRQATGPTRADAIARFLAAP